MTIVDGHVHVGLTRYVVVEVLVAQMDIAGIDKALLVQYGGCYNNAYLKDCMDRYPGRFAALGAVDYAAPDAAAQIRRQVSEYGLAGLRIPASVENEAVWETVGELGIVASLSGGMPHLLSPRVEEYIRRFPQVQFRIEHMGLVLDVEKTPDEPNYARLMQYAAYPNTLFMLSGFYAFGKSYPYREVTPFIKRALQCFGAQRLMWGSDFPRVCAVETCEMTLELPLRGWDFLSAAEREWILGRTASALFDF